MLVDSQSLSVLLSCVKKSVAGMDEDEEDDEMDGSGAALSNKAKRGLMLLKVARNRSQSFVYFLTFT